jgi:acyl carrier protein
LVVSGRVVRELLGEVSPSIDWAAIADSATLEECGLDSLDKTTLVLRLEEMTSRAASDEDFEKLHSISDLVEYFRPQEPSRA